MLYLHSQPGHIGFFSHADPLYPRVAPLLSEMNGTFAEISAEIDKVVAAGEVGGRIGGGRAATRASSAAASRGAAEIAAGARILALRASHVLNLYVATSPKITPPARHSALARSREILRRAAAIVVRASPPHHIHLTTTTHIQVTHRRHHSNNNATAQQQADREAEYRLPAEMIGGWRETPTAYHFGYLWEVAIMPPLVVRARYERDTSEIRARS